jgi:hypothetical protein
MCVIVGRARGVTSWPWYHSCGNIKGKRVKFRKRKGEKRKKEGFISTVTLSCDKEIQKNPRK